MLTNKVQLMICSSFALKSGKFVKIALAICFEVLKLGL